MDYITFIPLISFLYAFIHIIAFGLISKNTKSPKLPPGPPSYPLIGNLLQLGPSKLHQSLTKLSKTYGPIMSLKIGTINTVVISSPKITKEALHKNDQALSNRLVPESVQALSHDKSSIIFMPISPKWKTLRKICATKIFSSQQLDFTQALRLKKLKELVVYLQENCRIGSSQNFRDVVSSMLIDASKPNIADYYPILRRFDPQGAQRRMKNYYQKLITLFESIIKDRSIRMKDFMMEGSDVLDSFLDIIQKENPELTLHEVLHLFLDLFVAGTDTSSATVEWAMAELLQNPKKLKKLRKELQQVINKDEDPKDLDINKLPYLQAVVKETLRLHPSAPILVHKSISDVDLCGFRVPKDTQVLVNVWSMGRDSSIWTDPNVFLPERFLECGEVFRGEDFGFIPFGAGRRMCPGVPFAHRVVHTMLATLLYHFDWKLPNGEKIEDMDMTEKFGITLHKVKPLMIIPVKS
ncbi:cytochrome P450 76T24 [Trifolium repens]|nr:cytochrome P450 76T24 [Trifolium repens]